MSLRDFLGLYGTPHLLPAIAGTYRGGVVVCGDAACIWQDLELFGCRSDEGNGRVEKPGWDFLTVNRAVETFPGKVEHCYSNVSGVLWRFIVARRDEYAHEFGPPRHSHAVNNGCDWTWPWGCHGTSGLGSILTALALGYQQIVLCGMPLDGSGHNGEPYWRKCRFTTEVPDGDQHWKRAIDVAFEGKVKSLSGRTREWLGSP